jgi:hypothetical protein
MQERTEENKTGNVSMYVKLNIEARLGSHCFREKSKSITYYELVFVVLRIQREIRMRHIVVYGLSRLWNIFAHYLINSTIFEKNLLKIKCVF